MKARITLAALALAGILAGCSADAPTNARAPERASFDGGSLGPGHRDGEGVSPDGAPTDSTSITDERGGSLGPGH